VKEEKKNSNPQRENRRTLWQQTKIFNAFNGALSDHRRWKTNEALR